MATFVLVHGAWSGAYGFRHVRRLLQHRGHEVFTPSLTGIGERRHLTSPLVDLTTHVSDVVNQALYEDLCDVVLVGFSYGGCVVTGAVDHISSRIRHLVYLDAFVPHDGESIFSMTRQSDARRIALEEPWLVPPPQRSFDDPAESAFMIARRTPTTSGLLHGSCRTGQTHRGVSVRTDVHQGHGRLANRPLRRGVRRRSGARSPIARLAVSRDPHQPHDREQSARETRGDAPEGVTVASIRRGAF